MSSMCSDKRLPFEWACLAALAMAMVVYVPMIMDFVLAFYSHLDAPHNSHDIGLYTHATANWMTVSHRFHDFHPRPVDIPFLGEHRFLFGVHINALLLLFTPLVKLTQSFMTLIIAQTLALAATPVLLFHYFVRIHRAYLPGLVVALLFMADPAIRVLYIYDIRPSYFAVPLIVLSFTLVDSRRFGWFAVVAFLACMAKENVSAVYCGLGAYVFFGAKHIPRHRLVGSVIGLLAFALMVFEVKVLMQKVFSQDFELLAARYHHAIRIDLGDLGYVLKLLWPLALLPLFSWKILAAVPIIVQNILLTDVGRDHTVYNNALLYPALYLGAGSALIRLEETLQCYRLASWKRPVLIGCCLALPVLANGLPSHGEAKLNRIVEKGYDRHSPQLSQAFDIVSGIPRDASILTGFRLLPVIGAYKDISWSKDVDAGWRPLDHDYILFSPRLEYGDGFIDLVYGLDGRGLCYGLEQEEYGLFLLKKNERKGRCFSFLNLEGVLALPGGQSFQKDRGAMSLFPKTRNVDSTLELPLSVLGTGWEHLVIEGELKKADDQLAVFDYDMGKGIALDALALQEVEASGGSRRVAIKAERKDLKGNALLLRLRVMDRKGEPWGMRDAKLQSVYVY